MLATACSQASLVDGVPIGHPCRTVIDSCTPEYTLFAGMLVGVGHCVVVLTVLFVFGAPIVFPGVWWKWKKRGMRGPYYSPWVFASRLLAPLWVVLAVVVLHHISV